MRFYQLLRCINHVLGLTLLPMRNPASRSVSVAVGLSKLPPVLDPGRLPGEQAGPRGQAGPLVLGTGLLFLSPASCWEPVYFF